MKARRWWLLGIGGIAVALLAGRAVSSAYTDYRWYESMSALPLWRARFTTVSLLRLVSGAVATAFIFANLWAVRRTVVSLRLPRRLANIEIAEEVPPRYLLAIALAIAVLFGALVTLPAETWTAFTLANIGVPFNESDPHFQTDLGFYVYWLPVERELYYWSVIATLLVTVLVVFLYALTPSLHWERGRLHISKYVRRHLVVLCAVLVVTLAWSHRLDAFEVLLSGQGDTGVLTPADVDARIPIHLGLSVVTLVAAALVVIFGWTGQVKIAFIGIATILILGLVLERAIPPLVGRDDTDTERGRAYLTTRTMYTRRAYGLDRVRTADPGMLLASRTEAARAVAVWEVPALARWMSRSRESEGTTHAIGISASPASVVATVMNAPAPQGADSVTDGHWTLTHVLASTADVRGDPLRLRAGSGSRESNAIPAPVVYDGATGYVVVPDTLGTLAAPALSSTMSRLAHAWSLQNFRLLVSTPPSPSPRIVRRRGVRERVRALAPFFVQGRSVTPIARAGQLFWTLDLYATSANYPVSQHVALGGEEYSYVRHAATALVDAYTGRVTLVADETLDPVGASWVSRFPTLFAKWSEVPEGIAAATPPALDAAQLHALILARHGRRGEVAPRGQLPADEGADSGLVATATPSMAIPASGQGAAWTVPVLDDAGAVRGIVIATGGRDRGTFWLEVRGERPRWNEVLDRLRHYRDSLSDRPREAVLRGGRVRAIPLADRVIFAQSAYAWPSEGPPALVRVAAVDGDSLFLGRTLADAFGVTTPPPAETREPVTDESLRERAGRLYEAMRDALRRGDWGAFGEAYEALGALLARPSR
ncbi:MAG: UPF0182 family protein [Gemmatimonadaceae bacterium]